MPFLKILALLYVVTVLTVIVLYLFLNFYKKHGVSGLVSYAIGALIGLSTGLAFLWLIS